MVDNETDCCDLIYNRNHKLGAMQETKTNVCRQESSEKKYYI